MAESLLAQLAKAPVPGRVKTRLFGAISPETAASLHAAMVRRICHAASLSNADRVELWVDGDGQSPLFDDCLQFDRVELRRQRGDDLGARMGYIVEEGFAAGFGRVVLIGSDSPGLTAAYLNKAIGALSDAELVIGPALDGGYVLLGTSRPIPELFVDMPWGSDRVLEMTLHRLTQKKVEVTVLEPLPDIDRPEDLQLLPADLASLIESG